MNIAHCIFSLFEMLTTQNKQSYGLQYKEKEHGNAVFVCWKIWKGVPWNT